jgi:hypothetical protein
VGWESSTHRRHGNCLQNFGDRKVRLVRRRRGLERNIKMDFNKVECEGIEWVYMGQDRVTWWELMITEMNLRFP